MYVLDGGETSGENRLPFLDKGIIHRLAQVRILFCLQLTLLS